LPNCTRNARMRVAKATLDWGFAAHFCPRPHETTNARELQTTRLDLPGCMRSKATRQLLQKNRHPGLELRPTVTLLEASAKIEPPRWRQICGRTNAASRERRRT
jgi:hypothetical protein